MDADQTPQLRPGAPAGGAAPAAAATGDAAVARDTGALDGGAPALLLSGDRAALGPLRRDLIGTYQRWLTSVEVMRGLGKRSVMTVDGEQGWYEQATRDHGANHFTVYDLDDLAPVGTCSLIHIDHSNGTATFGIFIGERRGTGLGSDAARLTLDWAFTMLGLHNVMLNVFSWNERALRAYARAGFKEVGRRRGAVVTLGRRFDDVIMDAIASEFTGSVLAPMVPDGGGPALGTR
jgi:diamine N-acetyltransferase